MSEVTNRMGNQMDPLAGCTDFVEQHAMSSALMALGLGFGTGLVLVSVLSESMPSRQATLTQRLGQQMLDAMSSMIPDALRKR
jgi:hypothetical protein